MSVFNLAPHPETPAKGVQGVRVKMAATASRPNERWVEFHVAFDGALALPEAREPARADELWKTTCFEVFLKPFAGREYVEFNLSPSFQWAAYRFDGYRKGMRTLDLVVEPDIEITPSTSGNFWLAAELDLSGIEADGAWMNLTAVIEEADGTKSYWALAHPPSKPDFHDADCFVARLAAPEPA